ncbi:unnamed protein product [Microthlaspi erraticum]|uniref:Integrase catalytic domain-containing protein n=1 Tax=Microthlaspi erraticum TaxID=1685480 RepID=A0A6D2I8G7_9BRAS|nr:unnamed protein product [Microthlaspi erraticum]
MELEYREAPSSRTIGEGNFVRGRSDSRTNFSGKSKNNQSRSRSKDGKKVCWICGKEGHFKKKCYKWIERNKGKSHSQDSGESSLVRDDAKDLVGFLVNEVNMSREEGDHEEWIMDTGCTFHMTPRKDLFLEFKEVSNGKVRMANDSVSDVRGVGSVRFKNPDNTTFVLHDVRYMPGISKNLISMGTLEGKGCEFKGSEGILKVIKSCTVIMKGTRRSSLYILQGSAVESSSGVPGLNAAATVSQNKDQTELWHSRMGHIGQKRFDVLAKKECFGGSKVSDIKFCEDCVMRKTHRVSFGPAQHNTKEKLDYVHSDLWGSPNVPHSLSKCQYFISFTDDYSRKVWVSFLRFKDEAFRSFVEWKKMVETQSGRNIKKLRTANGLKFCKNQFNDFCKQEGMVRHKTCAYTPQQNGVAERLNRTIMNKVRSILSESGLSQKFWAEAVSTAVYLINRSPSSVIDFRVPEELWSTVMPSLENLRRFGCVAYVHSSDGELNPRAKKGVFTGYPEGVKGFKVWLLEEHKVVISRSVVFREDLVYKDIMSSSGGENQGSKLVNLDMVDVQGGATEIWSNEKEDESVQGGATKVSEATVLALVSASEDSVQKVRDYQLVRDRTKRPVKPPVRFTDYDCTGEEDPDDYEFAGFVCLQSEDGSSEPQTFQQAMIDPDSGKWMEAVGDEYGSLMKNRTWILIDRPLNQKTIGCKWIFTRKPGIIGVEDPRLKARLVAKDFSQKEGINYKEIFAPVVKHVSIRYILAAVVHYDMELQQMDVKTVFLHGHLDEFIVMDQPDGFVDKNHPDKVCLLKKSLYGLKQSPR